MGALVHCSTVHYAVIKAPAEKDHPERLVIAYQNENCLRDLIAAPSIVAAGFASRDEAMATLIGAVLDPNASKQKQFPSRLSYKAQKYEEAASGRVVVAKNRRHMVQCAVATLTVFFYSTNLFSVMLRMALGFSS